MSLSASGGAAPVPFLEQTLADADRLGTDLDQLVGLDVFETNLQAHNPRRTNAGGIVLAGRANVGQLLGLGGIDGNVFVLAMLADDLAFVDLVARPYEESAAVIQSIEGIGG